MLQEKKSRSLSLLQKHVSNRTQPTIAIIGFTAFLLAGCGVTVPQRNLSNAPGHGGSGTGSGAGSGGSGGTTGSGGTGSGGTGSGSSSGSGSPSGSTTPTVSSVYGSGTNADALNNLTIGPHVVSYRFLSTHSGTISNVHFFLIVDSSRAGYNSGTGGTLKVQLETDDGSDAHEPSGTALGTYTT